MNNEIKLKISLDGRQASDTLDKLEAKLNNLISEMSSPVNVSAGENQQSTAGNNFNALMMELKNAPLNYNVAPVDAAFKASLSVQESHEGMHLTDENLSENKKEPDNNAQQKKLTDTEKKYSMQRRKISDEENKYKLEGIETMLYTAAELFGKQTAAYKVLSIAEATISTYNAANAALLPPPVGLGPILGEIQAALVIANGLERVAKIASTKVTGYASGGIVIGEHGPEVIENMQDYAAGRAELIRQTVNAVNNNLGTVNNTALLDKVDKLNERIAELASRPSVAYLNNNEANKIYKQGNYSVRKQR